jgi:hypothetical protein
MSAIRRLVVTAAIAAVVGGVALAAPAQAQYASVITSTVYWTGADCISVRYSEGYSTDVAMKCGGYSERTRSVHRRRPDTTTQ